MFGRREYSMGKSMRGEREKNDECKPLIPAVFICFKLSILKDYIHSWTFGLNASTTKVWAPFLRFENNITTALRMKTVLVEQDFGLSYRVIILGIRLLFSTLPLLLCGNVCWRSMETRVCLHRKQCKGCCGRFCGWWCCGVAWLSLVAKRCFELTSLLLFRFVWRFPFPPTEHQW